jgi:hypothetical protein
VRVVQSGFGSHAAWLELLRVLGEGGARVGEDCRRLGDACFRLLDAARHVATGPLTGDRARRRRPFLLQRPCLAWA